MNQLNRLDTQFHLRPTLPHLWYMEDKSILT
jgi:hypothetical protein